MSITDRVCFKGNVSVVSEHIKTAKLFALTSDYEGMPNALAEAMAIGLACVSTDCSPGGARMLIEHGINGLITPCNDVQSFAEALRNLLLDTELAFKLSMNAINIRKKLDIEIISTQWENYLLSKCN